MPARRQQSGFTLVEVITVTVLLVILGSTALARYQDLSEAAEDAKVEAIYATVSNYIHTLNGPRYTLAGSPNDLTWVDIDGVNIRYRSGNMRVTQDADHVPLGTPNRASQATRLWYMIYTVPPPVITQSDTTSAGWAMYVGPAPCGAFRTRCWKYRRNGTELAVITYWINPGTVTLVKNF